MAKKKSNNNSTIVLIIIALVGSGGFWAYLEGCNGEEETQTEQTDPANEDRPGAVRKK